MSGQRIAITGSSGMIGGALSAYLRERGDTVIRLVRRHPVQPFEVRMPRVSDSRADLIAALDGVDAVVNLAGAGLADHRWTSSYKNRLVQSRLETTQVLVEALAQVEQPVRLVSGSAIGFYGNGGDEILTEMSPQGSGFTADLVAAWEAQALRASDRHPVALGRTSLVVSAYGGAFSRMAMATKFGFGGPLGTGRQWWSWISLRDEVRALTYLIDTPSVTGPVNLCSPRASRQVELARALGRSLMRPAITPAPEFALKLALGEMSSEVLASQRVHPDVLSQQNFHWLDTNPDLVLDELAAELKRPSNSSSATAPFGG